MKTIVPKLIIASIAFSVVASALALHAADKPKPWAKKFTMSREECHRRKVAWRKEHGMAPMGRAANSGWSNITNVHDYDSGKPSWVSKCRDKYGIL